MTWPRVVGKLGLAGKLAAVPTVSNLLLILKPFWAGGSAAKLRLARPKEKTVKLTVKIKRNLIDFFIKLSRGRF
jgi:hypothetical protein